MPSGLSTGDFPDTLYLKMTIYVFLVCCLWRVKMLCIYYSYLCAFSLFQPLSFRWSFRWQKAIVRFYCVFMENTSQKFMTLSVIPCDSLNHLLSSKAGQHDSFDFTGCLCKSANESPVAFPFLSFPIPLWDCYWFKGTNSRFLPWTLYIFSRIYFPWMHTDRLSIYYFYFCIRRYTTSATPGRSPAHAASTVC